MLFAGVLAAGNIQRPKFGADTIDASVDFFAIAAPSSDRVYTAQGEAKDERDPDLAADHRRQSRLAGDALHQGDAAVPAALRRLRPRPTTVESYRLPSSTLTNGIGGAWEYQRGGYSVVLNGTWFARASWRDWGSGAGTAASAADAARARTYTKYAATVSRTFQLGAFQKLHLNGAWFGGRDLDRFVKYQFGMFDPTRIHGVPVSGVRFAELAMVRGSYSFNLFDQYRLDLFVDHAWGRDDAVRPHLAVGARNRRGGQLPCAMEYDLARGCRQELPAAALRPARLHDVADHAAETAAMTDTLRADLHVHTCHSTE